MASADVMAAVQKELQELETKFLEKLEKSTRTRANTEPEIEKPHLHTISTPSIDAMMTSQVNPYNKHTPTLILFLLLFLLFDTPTLIPIRTTIFIPITHCTPLPISTYSYSFSYSQHTHS